MVSRNEEKALLAPRIEHWKKAGEFHTEKKRNSCFHLFPGGQTLRRKFLLEPRASSMKGRTITTHAAANENEGGP